MASQNLEMVIRANPAQPVQEINNIIVLFLQQWPGSEELILQGVRAEIDKTIEQLKATNQAPVPSPPVHPPNKRTRRQQKNIRR